MKYILMGIFFLGLSTSSLKAQQDTAWAPIGGTWVYDEITMTTWSALKMVSLKDTSINNITTRQIQLSRLRSIFPPYTDTTESIIGYEYMYGSNDTVYWWINNSFEPLYIFSAQLGDKWLIHKYPTATYPCDTTVVSDTVMVQNISFQNYNGVQLEQISLESVGNNWELNTLLKGIGAYSSPFPTMSFENCQIIDGALGSVNTLQCYADPIRGNINFGGSTMDCSTLLTVNTIPIKPSETTEKVVIFPNPVQNVLSFKLPSKYLKYILITNMLGQVVLQKTNFQASQLDVSLLESGTYVIMFVGLEGKNVYSKFIKL